MYNFLDAFTADSGDTVDFIKGIGHNTGQMAASESGLNRESLCRGKVTVLTYPTSASTTSMAMVLVMPISGKEDRQLVQANDALRG